MRELSFVKAISEFFGRLPDQTLQQFSAEIKALTPADRAELIPLLEKELDAKIEDKSVSNN